MRPILCLGMALLGAPAITSHATASEREPVPAVQPQVVESRRDETPRTGQMVLKEAKARSTASVTETQAVGVQRGSFWWLVGVIVVAGVILAILL